MSERLALMVATKVRDMLRPSMPLVTSRGRKGKLKPVSFCQRQLDGEYIVYWAVPEGTKLPNIPTVLYNIQIKQKKWEGPAPDDIQKLAMKAFGKKP